MDALVSDPSASASSVIPESIVPIPSIKTVQYTTLHTNYNPYLIPYFLPFWYPYILIFFTLVNQMYNMFDWWLSKALVLSSGNIVAFLKQTTNSFINNLCLRKELEKHLNLYGFKRIANFVKRYNLYFEHLFLV